MSLLKENHLRLDAVRSALSGHVIGGTLEHFPCVGSTSDLSWKRAQDPDAEGWVVSADLQTRGRGRSGAVWHSNGPSGLWFSVVLKPDLEPENLGKLTCVTAVAVADAVGETTGLPARIKWPNDVWIHERKVCGILTEMRRGPNGTRTVVLGVGININQEAREFPREIRPLAASLKMSLGRPVDRTDLLIALLVHLDRAYGDLLLGRTGEWETRFIDMNLVRGRRVKLLYGEQVLTGRVTDLSCTDGITLLLDRGESRTFRSEHVSQVDPLE